MQLHPEDDNNSPHFTNSTLLSLPTIFVTKKISNKRKTYTKIIVGLKQNV